ncbi:hypothetical protein NIES2119_07875 [[Phormidium ambiguum] IAM M-71]|uniref:DUF4335 domain-containing protein n=1 Tax=[Phormidium ambiguum] IAM M-71 TaxID=454136 RepID=A0A1U7INW2_9CYAN|nr:DUF4335 domain-containing protein [Phormidium ambiguum]OKH39041.1 hypothetical protein NIES2119_07875 [Phormidium ambiguum IAM M-71]
MTIQRQYSLPNCTLILEGLSETTGGIPSEIRPILTILVNAECRLAGYTGPALSGGRDFFESLVTAVSNYAQGILSGVPHQQHLETDRIPLVQLRHNGQNLHRLIVQPQNLNNFAQGITAPPLPTNPIEVDLSTVQLFDLVEAVDQFFADSQTLPSLKLQLAPVEKRFAKSDEDLVKQAAPAALGLSSLALAAIALFFVPIPEVQKPREPLPQDNSGVVTPNSTIPGQTPTNQPPPLPPTTPQSNSGIQNTAPVTSSTTQIPENNPAATPLTTQVPPTTTSNLTTQNSVVVTPVPVAPTVPQTDSTVAVPTTPTPVTAPTVPPATDSTAALPPTPVPVTAPTVPPSTDSTFALTPTPAPVTAPTLPSTDTNSVVQTPVAVPTIPPNDSTVGLQTPGITSTSEVQTSSVTNATLNENNEIVDTPSLKVLNRNLHNQIKQRRTEVTKFPDELVYRIAMRPDGTVVNYEPRNQAAREYLNQTPLPNLGAANIPPNSPEVNQQPVAYFKVVFTPKGILQVSPWRGYR